jgi:hypothetical protein
MKHILILTVFVGLVAGTAAIDAQKPSPADLAARLSGTWKVNQALSPSLAPRGRGLAEASGPRYVLAGLLVQRGGRGGGGGGASLPQSQGDLTPAERAEQAAMQHLRQIAPELTIKATAESVSFVDMRGEQTCNTNNKGTKLTVGEAPVNMKCKWDKQGLRQEFSTTRSSLIRTWSLDEADHLVLKARYEGLAQNSAEAVAVFDRVSQ